MLKRVLFFLLLNVTCILYGQQITRFALVDLPRVYTTFFSQSSAVREFEERSARVQSEINRRTNELLQLRARHSEAVLQGNQAEASRLELQVYAMNEAIREYYQTNTAILEAELSRLMQSDSFLNQVYDEIRYIAESEGYSMVLNSRDNTSIIWYNPVIDITDRVISSLQAKVGN